MPPPEVLRIADPVAIREVRSEFSTRSAEVEDAAKHYEVERSELESRDYEQYPLARLIPEIEQSERSNLAAIAGVDPAASPLVWEDVIRRAGSHAIASLWRGMRGENRFSL
jgi:hypothetical protein